MLRLFSCLLILTVLSLLPASFALAVNYEKYSPPSDTVQVAVDDIPLFFSPYASSPLDLQYAHLFFDPIVRWENKQQLEMRLM